MQIVLLDKDGKPVPDGEAGENLRARQRTGQRLLRQLGKDERMLHPEPDKPVFPRYSVPHGRYRRQEGRRSAVFPVAAGRPDQAHGYRIELGEIETALHSVDGIAAAACLFDRNRDRIACIYEGEPDAAALARAMRRLVPKYMLPNIYEKLDALPMNANGKIDRVKLKEQFIHAED